MGPILLNGIFLFLGLYKLYVLSQVWGMISEGVDGIEPAKVALQKAADADQQFRVLLLDMWLHGKDASELVNFLHERPNLLGTSPRITPLHKGDSNLMVRAVGDLEESESESEGDEVLD